MPRLETADLARCQSCGDSLLPSETGRGKRGRAKYLSFVDGRHWVHVCALCRNHPLANGEIAEGRERTKPEVRTAKSRSRPTGISARAKRAQGTAR